MSTPRKFIAAGALAAVAALSACGGGSGGSSITHTPGAEVSPTRTVATQLGSLCPSPAPVKVVDTVEALDCGSNSVRVETFKSTAERDSVFAAVQPPAGLIVFVGATIVQTADAATATQAASLTGGQVQ